MYRLTHTLLESWRRATDPEADETAFASFLDMLERKKEPKSAAMKTGIEFEDDVNYYIKNGLLKAQDGPVEQVAYPMGDTIVTERPFTDPHSRAIISFGNRLRGAQLQVRAETPVEIDRIPFLLVGVADALHAGIISDIKRPMRYEYGKYFDSTQHPMYMELFPEALWFDYLIFDGSYCYREQYHRGDFQPIHDTIRAFARYLNDADLMDTYKKFWEEK